MLSMALPPPPCVTKATYGLSVAAQFIISIYQRTHSWTERECRQLWDDIIRTGSNDAISAHFVGSIAYIE
jgi:uncharacterized protein with ParB-like and HNH nuclease domain